MIITPAPTNSSGEHIATSANGDIGTSAAEHFAVLGAQVFTTVFGDRFQGRCENKHRLDTLFTSDQSQIITSRLLSVDGGLR
ncbi:MAG: hypothetical protein ABJE63_04425 [Lentilitoribacter sp.]